MKKLLRNLSNSEMNRVLDEVAREHPEDKSSVDVIKSQFPVGEQSEKTQYAPAIDVTQPQPLTLKKENHES
jgi:hypothetical protein